MDSVWEIIKKMLSNASCNNLFICNTGYTFVRINLATFEDQVEVLNFLFSLLPQTIKKRVYLIMCRKSNPNRGKASHFNQGWYPIIVASEQNFGNLSTTTV